VQPPRRRHLGFYFGVTFLLLHLGVALLRREAVVSDPGIGWHLATGRLILATGTLPRVDQFSFTAAGRPWINYYWLFEIVSALCERVGGLVFFAAVWTVVYGLIPVVMYRNAIRAGASPLAALPVTLAAYAVLVSHAFARPHVVTYLFFAVVVGCIGDVVRDRRTVRSLWWLPVMMTLWVNMHGGFLSGLWAVAVAAAASAAHGLVARDRAELGRAGRLGGLLIAMAIASLANPWGYHLHVQAVEHLGLPSTGYFGEFQSPNFRDGGGPVKTFELLALALTGAGLLGVVQTTWVDIALAVGTLHLALTAVRNMNLFVIVAAPMLACAVTGLVRARWPRVDARWSEIASEQEARGPWVQAAAIASLWLAVGLAGRLPFPTSLVGVRRRRSRRSGSRSASRAGCPFRRASSASASRTAQPPTSRTTRKGSGARSIRTASGACSSTGSGRRCTCSSTIGAASSTARTS
jgi:hypothetical protein